MSKSIKNAPELFPQVQFIQIINVDINGFSRGKMFPISKLPDLLEGKEEVVNVLNIMGTKSEIPFSIKEISDGFENKNIVLDKESLQIAPWCNDNSLAIVFFDLYDIKTHTPFPFNPRLLAQMKIKELEQNGYKLLIGVENEFRVFRKSNLEPITKTIEIFDQFTAATVVLPYVMKLNEKLKPLDIEMDSWNLEYGKGQIEIPLKPYIGLEGLDKTWFFKEVSKYVANDMDLVASYMTSPLAKDTSNGLHINHSLLRSVDLVNVMKSDENDGKLSAVGQNWLAGLMKHTPALMAFMNPTVNCYRRIQHGGFAPSNISWDYLYRTVSYRVKTCADVGSRNYIENRTPSSSCNIYLAISAMIVAGLDGIKNELTLQNPGNNEHCESLPNTLKEALKALDEDVVLRDGLGGKFVDWYIKAKTECDVNILGHIDLGIDTSENLELEFDKYFKL